MSDPLVIGLDVGGTSTRALVVSVRGQQLGSGLAGGGNPTSHGAEPAAAELGKALAEALAAVDPARVRAGIIGLAGVGRLIANPEARDAFERAWRAAGLRCPLTVVGDALVAYASGTAAPDGTVLIAGTGAIAASVRGFALDRVADGHGWLLGDAGSGFWLGREAVRTTLAALDASLDLGPLTRSIMISLLGSTAVAKRPRDTVDSLVQRVTHRPAIELAALAPLVISAHSAGDPSAVALVAEAARLLTASVGRIRPPGDATPIVLGGGLLTGTTPLAPAVGAALADQWPAAPVSRAGDGAAAAAWLAARGVLPAEEAAALHAALF
ncbi:N-acetylglucosamine kinase [Phytohabitans rumicis]|uniref:N-acetylglucosamine kinase n=1 Tax=Phytohabitans rumicis TaxID=1076125 RepID=UPI001565A5FD|nr:BadF/BadG/BcrA/BcrD ATPase family protein [Phytohabitans rumicis]